MTGPRLQAHASIFMKCSARGPYPDGDVTRFHSLPNLYPIHSSMYVPYRRKLQPRTALEMRTSSPDPFSSLSSPVRYRPPCGCLRPSMSILPSRKGNRVMQTGFFKPFCSCCTSCGRNQAFHSESCPCCWRSGRWPTCPGTGNSTSSLGMFARPCTGSLVNVC